MEQLDFGPAVVGAAAAAAAVAVAELAAELAVGRLGFELAAVVDAVAAVVDAVAAVVVAAAVEQLDSGLAAVAAPAVVVGLAGPVLVELVDVLAVELELVPEPRQQSVDQVYSAFEVEVSSAAVVLAGLDYCSFDWHWGA